MNYHFRLLLFSLFFHCLSASAMGKCLQGIYTAGMSGDSTVYQIKASNNTTSELATDVSIGTKIGSMVFCPKERMEFNPYLKHRFMSFKDSQKHDEYRQVASSYQLLSIGHELRYIWKRELELLIDSELRQDLSLIPDEQLNAFQAKKTLNLKLLAGIRYFIYQQKRTEIATRIKAGPIIPVTDRDQAKLGYLYGLDLAIFQKMGKRHSLEGELFWENYQQDLASNVISRKELGLRLSYIFRM